MKTYTMTFARRAVGLGAFVCAAIGILGVAPSIKAQILTPQLKGAMGEIQKRLAQSRQRFMENKGQWSKSAKYLAQYPGMSVWITDKGWKVDQYRVSKDKKQLGQIVDFSFVGGNKSAKVLASDRTSSRFDFINKKHPAKGVRGYGEVRVKNIYPGTDIRWYAENGKPRFDVILAPGSDPSKVKLKVSGAKKIEPNQKGELVVSTSVGRIHEADLKAYQQVDGKKVSVPVSFKLLDNNEVAFQVGEYDRSRELVIDPLVYGSYYGGNSLGMGVSGWDEVRGVTEDTDFGVYVTGWTQSPQFPAIAGPYSFNISGVQDAFFSKFQGDAYNHDYSAFIGGSGSDTGQFVGIDPSGTHIWMVGNTDSGNFPMTGTPLQNTLQGASDIFLVRFTKNDVTVVSPDYSTYYGGTATESLTAMAVAPISGDVILSGTTTGSLPSTNNSYLGGASDAYITRFSTDSNGLSGFRYSFYVGGIGTDLGAGVGADPDDNALMSGSVRSAIAFTDTSVSSARFFTTAGVFANGRLLRNNDGFVRKYDNLGNIVYSALLGGNGNDSSTGLAVDTAGNAYLTGVAGSFNFPRTPGVYGENFDNSAVVYCTKINQDGSEIVYSTHLHTTGAIDPRGVAVDNRGTAWITGTAYPYNVFLDTSDPAGIATASFGTVPVTGDALDPTYESPQPPNLPTSEGFILALTPTATSLLYGSYLGGLLDEEVFAPYVNRFGDAWAVGSTDSFRYILRISSTGTTILETFDNGSLPATLLSPFAFKTIGDQSADVTEIFSGAWAPPGAFIFVGSMRDGFLVKHRQTLPTITSLTLNPSDVPGGLGASSTGTITLSGPVPAGGVDITVTLNNAAASFSAGGAQDTLVINLPGGATTAQFTIFTNPVTAPTQVQVRATLEGNFMSRILTVEPWLQQLSVTPTSIVGGNLVTGRVTLWQAAISDITIDLSTDTTGLIDFPNGNTVTVLAGTSTATFTIRTHGVEPVTDVPVTASLLGVGKTAFVRLLPANLASITFNPTRVTSGTSSTGTLTLDGEAGSTFVVNLTLNAGTAGYSLDPVQLTFNQGDRSKTFTINTAVETANTQRTVTATRPAQGGYSLQSVSGTLFVDAASLIGFTLTPAAINPGEDATGTLTINVPAQTGGAAITMTSSNPVLLPVPSPVIIDAGATSGTFTATAANIAVAADTVVTLTATRGTASIARNITIRQTVATLSFNPFSVVGGNGSTGTLTVAAPAGVGGLTFTLASNTGSVTVPGSVTILEGETSVDFAASTSLVGSTVTATITATSTIGSIVVTGQLQVTAIGVVSVSFNPSRVRGPQSTQMTITIDAPAPVGGLVVSITSSNPGIATVPSSVTILAGQSSRTVTVTTRRVSRTLATLVTATAGGKSANTILTVTR